MTNEQGLVERLLAGAKPEPKIDTTLFVSEERQREMLFRVTLPFAGPNDIADAIREAIEETVRTIQRHTRDHAAAQSVQIAELQAEVDRRASEEAAWRKSAIDQQSLRQRREAALLARADTAEAQIADLKRALDTARHALRENFCPRPCNHRPADFEVGPCVDAGECGCMNAFLKEKSHG